MINSDDIILSQKGDLRSGYFYELLVFHEQAEMASEVAYVDEPIMFPAEDATLTDNAWVMADVQRIGEKRHHFRCSEDPEHVTETYWYDVTVKLWNGDSVSPIIELDRTWEKSILFRGDLALALRESGLRGFGLQEVEIDLSSHENPQRLPTDLQLFEVHFEGPCCLRPLTVVGRENICPNCNGAEVVCRGCRLMHSPCRLCGKSTFIGGKHLNGPDDKRLTISSHLEQRPAVIDGHNWDGSDFVFGSVEVGTVTHLVTRRTVDWLAGRHAFPFAARPAVVDASRMTTEQLDALDNALRIQ